MSTENEVKKYVQFYSTALGKKILEQEIVDTANQNIASLFVLEGKNYDR